jgi:hypothetical protein
LVAIVVAVVVVLGGIGAALALGGGGSEGQADEPTTTERSRTPRTDDEETTTTEEETTTTDTEPETTTTTEPVVTTTVPLEISVFDTFVGLCFDNPPADSDSITSLTQRSCDEPHDGEVYELAVFPHDESTPYPGDQAVKDFAQIECNAAFEPYVGRDYPSSQLVIFWLTPNQGSWEDPDLVDREIVCYVMHINEGPLFVPAEGSGL